jgi:hypothetical protein
MSIPLSLKMIAVVLVVLIILLIIVIRKKRRELVWRVIFVIALVVGFGVWRGLKEYNRTYDDPATVKADIKISAVDLIHDYRVNDSIADQKYLGKVIEINGNIRKIEQDEKGYYTIVLGDTVNLSSVRCSMDTVHVNDAAHLVAGSSVIVRGSCTGFNKDEMGLGSDVILNRCAVITKKE